jgi:hypothetical protein
MQPWHGCWRGQSQSQQQQQQQVQFQGGEHGQAVVLCERALPWLVIPEC